MLVDPHLLRLATEIEVGEYTPLLERLNLLNDESRCVIGDPQKPVPPACGVGQNNHEENRRLAAPVIPERGYDVEHIRRELLGGSCNCGLEQRLLRDGQWEVHESIIARLRLRGDIEQIRPRRIVKAIF